MAKKPRMWIMRIDPSNWGRNLPTTVFIIMVNTIDAQNSRTVCHGWGVYEGVVKVIKPCICAPAR